MQGGRDWARVGIAGGALAFLLVSAAFMQGWLVPLDVAADKVIREPFGHWSDPGGTYDYVVLPEQPGANKTPQEKSFFWDDFGRDGDKMFPMEGAGNRTCQRADTLESSDARLGRWDYGGPSRTMYCDGNFTLNVPPGGYWVDPPWGGYASYFGSESAAFALLTATTLLLAALGAWRTAIVALAFGAVGGALVDPMKGFFWPYGERHYGALDLRDYYPSGHTIGGTLQFGLALLLGARALQRAGLARDLRLMRKAVTVWAVIAFAVGIDRIVIHTHILSDVLAGWAFGLAFVCGAFWADRRWHEARIAPDGPSAPEAA